jgi:hypothetical protein
MFQTRRKTRVELNFFEHSDSKRYHVEPDVVEYNKNNRPQYDLNLGTVSIKDFSIILNFRDKMITIDEISCQCETSIICKALAFSER